MQKHDRIDFDKLLGFGTVSDRIDQSVDLREETVAARLGAKVGLETMVELDVAYDAALKAAQ
jgi:hypothetical protein